MIVAAIVAITLTGLVIRCTYLKDRLEEQKQIVAQLKYANNTLSMQVRAQNKAIDDIAKAADENLQKKKQELEQVKKEAEKSKAQAVNILKIQKPKNISACDAANALLKQELLK